MTIDMSQFFQVFFDEAEELLAEKERLLLAVDISAPDLEHLNAIFRTAHSIKGGAATFGLTDMTEVTHILESLLDKIRKGEMALTSEHVDAFFAAKDVLKMQLDGHRNGAPVDQDAVANVRMLLQSLSQNVAVIVPAPTVPATHRITQPLATFDADATHRFRIELPNIAAQDMNALSAELGLLGHIVLTPMDEGKFVLSLATNEKIEDIIAICAFILNPEDMKISDEFMLAPLPGAAEDATKIQVEKDQGFGFFDPLPLEEEKASTDEQRGYGFFEPVPESEPTEPTDEKRGYGFFQPLEKIKELANSAASSMPSSTASSTTPGEAALESASAGHPERRTSAKREVNNGQDSSSIRVSIEKVDQLINLVGELVITQAMIEQRTDSLDPMAHERLLNSVSQLTRNTHDLQEAVMSIRMMPMDFVFSRFPRMVRDLATKLGKKVDFITHGASTELDKGLIERIVDPLTHLVRNSIDHGIEMPGVRSAAGKSEVGKLFLSARHQGGNIVIEVSDDGGGLQREKILAKAAQQNLVVSDGMKDSEVWQLIFAPGFSTAEIVTDVSGRGVGMDVVKRNIAAMGGAVDIRSAKGFGTTIAISLPLTLAILDGMSIRVGEEIYILPLGFVIESLQPTPEDIKEISGKGRVVKVRGEYLPLIPLYQMFGITPRFTEPWQGIVVILESDGRKAALFVDDLVGQQQVVVKNLESNYRKVAGISGATILGDGGVSLILDVSALLRSSRQLADETTFSS